MDALLGPLAFPTLAASSKETLGDTLQTLGGTVMPGERRPRPRPLTLAVRGENTAANPKAAGQRLRRQLRQLLENGDWLGQGLYFHWAPDPELDGWLMIAGGDLDEQTSGMGLVLGDWTVELTDPYIVARPGAARRGRRLELGDRRTGLVPHDTRGLLFTTDYDAQPLPANPLILPSSIYVPRHADGELADINESGIGWYGVPAVDGDIVSYLPSADRTDPLRFLKADQPGQLRVWDTRAATTTISGDITTMIGDPTTIGWEAVYGRPVEEFPELAVDNGIASISWSTDYSALALDYYDAGLAAWQRFMYVKPDVPSVGFTTLDDFNPYVETTVIELTPERAVIEWRIIDVAIRAILQRGWPGPRLEVYQDGATTPLVYFYSVDSTITAAAGPGGGAPSVRAITRADNGKVALWARTKTADSDSPAGGGKILHSSATVRAPIVFQLALPSTAAAVNAAGSSRLGSLAIADARNVPVLVAK